jgi:hypothetical protein
MKNMYVYVHYDPFPKIEHKIHFTVICYEEVPVWRQIRLGKKIFTWSSSFWHLPRIILFDFGYISFVDN